MRRFAIPLACALGLAACTTYDRYGYDGYGPEPGYDEHAYVGDDWQMPDDPNGRLDPWFEDTEEGREIVERTFGDQSWHPAQAARLNLRFRLFADTDRDFRVTDEEVRLALVRCARQGWN